MNFRVCLVTFVVGSAGAALAVNFPAARPTPIAPEFATPVIPAAPAVTPKPGAGFSSRTPVDFDPAKFGTLTTSTLPVQDGRRLVGRVNGRPVTWEDFLVSFEVTASGLLQQHPASRDGIMAALAAPVLDSLVMQELNREFAAENNLRVSDEEAKRKAGEILEQAVAAEKQALQRLGRDQLLSLAKDTLVREKVEKFIGDRATSVPPTLDEITSISATAMVELTTSPEETLRARHIVIRAIPGMSDFQVNDARAKAEEVLEKIRAGFDFATAARQFSQDRFTAYLGGNIGYFNRGDMFKEFEDAAFALQPGQVSGIVRTPVGFHIIQVTERHPDNLRVLIDDLRRFQAVEAWKRNARGAARVENFLLNEKRGMKQDE